MSTTTKPTKDHAVNGIVVEQRMTDGFINGTAMCVAHRKKIANWLKTDEIWDVAKVLAENLGLEVNYLKSSNSVFTRVTDCFPDLAVVKRGNPSTGGGTWLHPDLAIQLAQWCSPKFAIQVSRWVRDWLIGSSQGNGYNSADEFYSSVKDELKNIRGEVKQLANCYKRAQASHPGLRELIDEYGKDEIEAPLGLPNPFIYSQWALLTGYPTDLGTRRRIAESVKSLRKVSKLKRTKNNQVIYYHSDLPAFKAVLSDIQQGTGKIAHFKRYHRL